jgi:Phytochelatin synthase
VLRSSISSNRSYQHHGLLEQAWELPVAKRYAPLLSQSFTSICGPTSAANVLRSIGVKTGRNPFRRFGLRAMSLDEVVEETAEVLPAGWRGSALRLRSVVAVREQLRLSNAPGYRFITNFSRASLFGRGGGHHSPIGGYLEEEDLAFVLDVNAGFGPWLVSAERLFDAMNSGGPPTRGLARFERA